MQVSNAPGVNQCITGLSQINYRFVFRKHGSCTRELVIQANIQRYFAAIVMKGEMSLIVYRIFYHKVL